MQQSRSTPAQITPISAALLVSRFLALRLRGALGSFPALVLVFLPFFSPSGLAFSSDFASSFGSGSGAEKTVPHLGHSTSVPASGASFRRSLARQSGQRS